jgi:branched-chain amino acid transport system ATP-binding protein
MLEITDLSKHFGGLQAVSGVDMTVHKGEIVGLIGPNGAGKTTFFNLVSGVIKPSSGRVVFEGANITGRKTHNIAARGLVRTFQGDNIYPDFTVLENLILSFHLKSGIGLIETFLHTGSSRRKDADILERSHHILDTVGMSPMAHVTAKNLAHGHKRTLGIAIALAAEPKLLMLDEPLGGMNGHEVSQTMELVTRLWESGITVLLIEHNMRATMNLCQRIVVLSFGRKIAEGLPSEVQANDEVIRAYLGSSVGADAHTGANIETLAGANFETPAGSKNDTEAGGHA